MVPLRHVSVNVVLKFDFSYLLLLPIYTSIPNLNNDILWKKVLTAWLLHFLASFFSISSVKASLPYIQLIFEFNKWNTVW